MRSASLKTLKKLNASGCGAAVVAVPLVVEGVFSECVGDFFSFFCSLGLVIAGDVILILETINYAILDIRM